MDGGNSPLNIYAVAAAAASLGTCRFKDWILSHFLVSLRDTEIETQRGGNSKSNYDMTLKLGISNI